jgi:hypothetical protein
VGPWGEPVANRGNSSGIQQAKAEIMQPHGDMNSNIRQVNGSNAPPMPTPVAGAVAATGALVQGGGPRQGCGRTSVYFVRPSSMSVSWFNGTGPGGFTPTMVKAPGRYNFPQGATFRLKLSDLPNRPGVELYPTLEVIPANSKSGTFLAHSAVPISVTEEDLEQVAAGNFVVKVVYLPDPAFQDLAAVGPDEIVSSRLEPGVDPVAEATRRGTVLLILRMGNIDLEGPQSMRMEMPAGGPPPRPMGPMGGSMPQMLPPTVPGMRR